MNEQVEQNIMKAFWNLLEEDVSQNKLDHIKILLEEIIEILCNFVPNRKDIHEKIRASFSDGITWKTQNILIDWIEKFQAPVHDSITQEWKTDGNSNITEFLKKYYKHLEKVNKEIFDARQKLSRGENLFVPDIPKGSNNIPSIMKSGKH